MRPKSIVVFERLLLGSIALSLLNAATHVDQTVAEISGDGWGLIPGLAITLAIYGIEILLWFLVAREASNAAKWMLVGVYALTTLLLPEFLAEAASLRDIIDIVSLLMAYLATALLFRRSARKWLRGEAPVDLTTFE